MVRQLRGFVARIAGGLRIAAREQMLIVVIGMIPRLLRHSAWREAKARQGRGVGVLLVPGFG